MRDLVIDRFYSYINGGGVEHSGGDAFNNSSPSAMALLQEKLGLTDALPTPEEINSELDFGSAQLWVTSNFTEQDTLSQSEIVRAIVSIRGW